MPKSPFTRDVFAELYVAGLLADANWNIYFPTRDIGFDFIATKSLESGIIIRPVQVKGKYPTSSKKDVAAYGFGGWLSQLHEQMVLAIAFFTSVRSPAPTCTAFMPFGQIRSQKTDPEWWQSMPAQFTAGSPVPRRDYRKFFDDAGIRLMESSGFPSESPTR
jgi:hypothetical protein